MKYLKYILAVLIVFIAPNVFAWDLSNKVEALPTFGNGTYSGQTATSPTAVVYNNIGTRYQGKLSVISFFLDSDDWDWNYGRTYTIELYMETNDWDNNFMYPQVYKAQGSGTTSGSNLAKSSVSFISNKKIKFTFKTPDSDMSPYLFFRVYSSNYMTTGITRITNYNFNKVLIYENQSSSGGSSSGGSSTPTPTATPSSTDQIIDSSIKNTEDIINNNNQNTQDIIENNNNNFQNATETIVGSIDSIFGNCVISQYSNVSSIGSISTSNYYVEIDIDISNIDKSLTYYWGYTLSNLNLNGMSSVNSTLVVMYTDNTYQEIAINNITQNGNYVSSSFTFNQNKTISWIHLRFLRSFTTGTTRSGNVSNIFLNTTGIQPTNYDYLSKSCTSKVDETNKEIKDLNDKLDGLGRVIEDSQVDDKSSFFTGFTDNSHGLTGIITLPLSTIQTLTNTSCVPLSVPIPFTSSSVSLPCMSAVYEEHIPTIYSLWQVVSFGIISYFICIDIFKMVKGFKDPNEDKVEVLDL